jgi:hypothetical protein
MSTFNVLSRLSFDWGVRCFGMVHMRDKRIRALRCVEEAIELAQACKVDQLQLHKLIDYVYDRPVGVPEKEVGGVFVTAAVISECLNDQPEAIFEAEIRRVLAKDPSYFAERNRLKEAAGFG